MVTVFWLKKNTLKTIVLPDFWHDKETGNLYRLKKHIRKSDTYSAKIPHYIICDTKHSRGYYIVCIAKKNLFVHRFVWEMYYGKIPKGMVIDHIDGDKTNNKIENLRLVTPGENQKNLPITRRNKSGYLGVYQVKKGSEKGKWVAQINVDKKPKRIGVYSSAEEAHQSRLLHLVIHNYHENHGRTGGII